jgi:hypothetical protein
MDFEQELRRIAERYAAAGYTTLIRPGPDQLPPFAKDFRVELAAVRANGGVLVSVKRNRQEMEEDRQMSRYAEVTNARPGWRYDFVILEGEGTMGRQASGAREFSDEDISHALAESERMVHLGFARPAVITAWAALESAMRMRLRAAGEAAGWGTQPRDMMNELYSSGVLSTAEFPHLERVFHLRNQIAHGFSPSEEDAGAVQFLSELARRLLEESREQKQPA